MEKPLIILYNTNILMKYNHKKHIFYSIRKNDEEDKLLNLSKGINQSQIVKCSLEQRDILKHERMWHEISLKKCLLCNVEKEIHEFLLDFWKIKRKPTLIIIEGADGSGKTTLCNQLQKLLEKPVKINIKKKPMKDFPYLTHDQYRVKRTQMLNKNMVDFDINDNFIIVDKSPYVDIYYKKNPVFHEHATMLKYNWNQVMQAIYEEYFIMENAIKIFVENIDAERNYYSRGEQGNYAQMEAATYRQMMVDFENGIKEQYHNKQNLFKLRCENGNERNAFITYNIIHKYLQRPIVNIPSTLTKKHDLPRIQKYNENLKKWEDIYE